VTRALLAAALVLGVEGLAAQAAACTPEALSRDTVRYAIAVEVRLGRDSLPDSTASVIAGEAILGAGFRVPATIANVFPAGAQPREFAPRDEITLSRVMAYPSTGAGIATVRAVEGLRTDPATDAAFRRAVEQADVYPILPHRQGSDTLPVTLRLVASRGTAAGFALARLALPRVLYDSPPTVKRVATRFEIPESQRRAPSAGGVRFRFIVRTDGSVDSSSVTVLDTSHPDLVGPATASLLSIQFDPARSGRCPVEVLVEQTLGYSALPQRVVERRTVTGTTRIIRP